MMVVFIASPSLPSVESTALDALTIMIMKSKMLADIKESMKYTKTTHFVGFSWVCPLHIFVSIFYGFTFSQIAIMIVCKKVVAEHMVSLLGEQ